MSDLLELSLEIGPLLLESAFRVGLLGLVRVGGGLHLFLERRQVCLELGAVAAVRVVDILDYLADLDRFLIFLNGAAMTRSRDRWWAIG